MKPSEMNVGERMVDYMTGEVADLSSHICFIKMCENDHFCVLDYEHKTKCFTIRHAVECT